MLLLLVTPLALAAPPGDAATEEVVVQAPTDTVARTQAPAVAVLPVDARLSAATDVAELAASAPGVHRQRLGLLGQFSAVSIRGSSLRQVAVALDDIPLNPDGAAVVDLSEWPVGVLDRVEVWRGAAPPELSLSPIGGLVRLVTRDDPAPTVHASVGSYGTARLGGAGGGRAETPSGTVDGLATAELFRTAGTFRYFDDNATVYTLSDDRRPDRLNNDTSQLVALGRVRWRAPRLRISLLDSWLARAEGVPGPAGAPSPHARLDTSRNLLGVAVAGDRGIASGAVQGWWLARREVFDDRFGEVGVGTQQLDARYDHVGVRLFGRLTPHPVVSPWLALGVRHDRVVLTEQLTGVDEDPRTRTSGRAGLGVSVWPWRDRVRLDASVQALLLDNRALGEIPFGVLPLAPLERQLVVAVTPRVGALVWITEHVGVFANGSRGVRPPDLTELFGDRGALVGNGALRPEAGWHGDGGLRWRTPVAAEVDAFGELVAFGSEVVDRIVTIQNAQRTAVPVNVGRSRVAGVEVAATLRALGWVDLRTSLTWTHARNLTRGPDGPPLPLVPTWDVSTEASVHWQERVRVGHRFAFLDGLTYDATGVVAAAPRPLHDLFVRTTPARGWPSFELAVVNLADRYAEVVDRDPFAAADPGRAVAPLRDLVGYPLPGRTFLFTLRWTPGPAPEA